jgi:hypothetical protein
MAPAVDVAGSRMWRAPGRARVAKGPLLPAAARPPLPALGLLVVAGDRSGGGRPPAAWVAGRRLAPLPPAA